MRAISVSPWQLLSEYRSGDGTASIAAHYQGAERPHAFATILAEGLVPLTTQQGEQLVGAPIVISGMASSSIGWRELPYASLPISLDGSGLVWQELPPVASAVGEHRVLLISGVRSQTDIMRGEESELIGLFALPDIEVITAGAVVIKPGTHSKHLRICDGVLVDFQTYMTGELFAILCGHSLLKHSVGEDSSETHVQLVSDAFLAGVEQAMCRPISSAIFQVRTRDVLDNLPAAGNRDFLSGVLVGAELVGLTSEDSRTPIVLAATEPLATHYRGALAQLGLQNRLILVPPEDVELLSARGQARLLPQFFAERP